VGVVVLALFVTLPVWFAGAAFLAVRCRLRLRRHGVPATGVVVRVGPRDALVAYPAAGASHRLVVWLGVFAAGQAVPVRHLPDRPAVAVVDRSLQWWGPPLAYGFLAAVLAGAIWLRAW
jgi:hypothetical protein